MEKRRKKYNLKNIPIGAGSPHRKKEYKRRSSGGAAMGQHVQKEKKKPLTVLQLLLLPWLGWACPHMPSVQKIVRFFQGLLPSFFRGPWNLHYTRIIIESVVEGLY
jgi:hypothetical protein